MQKIILSFLLIIGFSTNIVASPQMESKITKSTKPISHKKIKRMDRSHTKQKAVRRSFKNKKEFRHRKSNRNIAQKRMPNKIQRNSRYRNGYSYPTDTYRDEYRANSNRGYSHPTRGWLLAFRYDRASFYDYNGYYYGYFNRYGYYFEDVFYRYDRYYSYRDRLKGRGLFDQKYYMPANAQEYGFCSPRQHSRGFTRAY